MNSSASSGVSWLKRRTRTWDFELFPDGAKGKKMPSNAELESKYGLFLSEEGLELCKEELKEENPSI